MMYNTLKIYATVRSKTLINHLFDIGLCIPYKRLLETTTTKDYWLDIVYFRSIMYYCKQCLYILCWK